jgi:YesN/AraC family two-component response regulator
MSGMDVLKRIKKEYPSIAVIMITSCGTVDTCTEAFENGARDYLRRPLNKEEVTEKIEKILHIRNCSQRREHVSLLTESPEREHYPDIPSHLVDRVLRVRDFIAQHYSETLTLIEACKMASLSKTYFCHFFKCITGYSLRNYQHVVKVHRAEELLRDKRLSITEVAAQLGYNDSNYFSTIYKKVTGSCPKYRKTSERHSN